MSSREAETEERAANRRLRTLLGVGAAALSPPEGCESIAGTEGGADKWGGLGQEEGRTNPALINGEIPLCLSIYMLL